MTKSINSNIRSKLQATV